MRRLTAMIGLGCGLALLLVFYRSVLFQGEQFGFRDSAHFYYPLYQKVQAEWESGRWPLWDSSENAGMPLLGNPTAAVLYPGKLIYTSLPYAWASRLYTVAHSVLAFVGMLVLMRSWGTSWAGSAISALAFTFGGPVVFQYCNIIFLVGAAWIPWGILAVDRWLRLHQPGAIAALAVVLAMQVLGGDPESAYLLGVCAGGYAVGLAWVARHGAWRIRVRLWLPIVAVGLLLWVGITLILAAKLPGFRPEPGEKPWGPIWRWLTSLKIPVFRPGAFEGPVSSLPWSEGFRRGIAGIWGLVGLVLVYRWWHRGSAKVPLVPMLAGLAASAVLAGALSAAQMVPAVEFTGLSGRATAEGAHDIYPFSLEPYRLLEAFWPGVFGRRFGLPVNWSERILPSLTHSVWVPTLYLGGLTAVLALSAMGFRQGPPWRAWLTAIAAVSLIGSFGEFASPITAARFNASMVEALGPHDLRKTNAVRLDGYLRDGDGSPYYLLAQLLPGFHSFRYPSKLLSFTALAVAALAGLGWDRALVENRRSKRLAWLAGIGSAVSLVTLIGVVVAHKAIFDWFEAERSLTIFGPFDATGALVDLRVALIQGTLVLAASAVLVILGRRRADLAGVLAVLLLTVDLGLANPSLIKTVPQADFESYPKVLRIIDEAERLNPSPGPYRIHRVPLWNPSFYQTVRSNDRSRDFVVWEHDTIQPKYGILNGVEYTYTLGVAELYDYAWFFSPFPRGVRPETASQFRMKPGEKVVVYPRRGFDLWNSRYFVLPAVPRWDDADRGIASFLNRTRLIYPRPELLASKADSPKIKDWLENEDFQVLLNLDAYPRAWVVHGARFKEEVTGLTRATRRETMEEILFSNDPFWVDPDRTLFDPRKLAWIETDQAGEAAIADYYPGSPTLDGESAVVNTALSHPQRVVLDVNLVRPGLVILADVFYPGWKLTIDNKPAPILRANRVMRGAAVKSGSHQLIYTYEPRSFPIGAAISLAGLAALVGYSAWCVRLRFRRGRVIAPGPVEGRS